MFNVPATEFPPRILSTTWDTPEGTYVAAGPLTITMTAITPPSNQWGIRFRASSNGIWVNNGVWPTNPVAWDFDGITLGTYTVDLLYYSISNGVFTAATATASWTFT